MLEQDVRHDGGTVVPELHAELRKSRPVIIIGAARSGTNILRDTMTRMPGYATWPCDEIQPIWRHGNLRHPTDELAARHARPAICEFIRRAFEKRASVERAKTVVEKTCANSLRVPFVDAVFPDARYLFLVRDGRDVVPSALKRWTAPMDLRYSLRKARFVPRSDVFFYAWQFARNRIGRAFSQDGRLPTWGPRFSGIDDAARERRLDEVCALQWARCVSLAAEALADLDKDRVLPMRYELLVTAPRVEIERLAEFLGEKLRADDLSAMADPIRSDSVGNWERHLDAASRERLLPILQPQLEAHGYL